MSHDESAEPPEVTASYKTLEIGEEEHRLEHEIAECLALPECIVVLWDTHASTHSSEPVIPERDRNVVGVNYDGTRAWRVAEPPHVFPRETYLNYSAEGDPEYESGSYFRYLLEIDGTVHARHTNLRRYELAPATGELLGSVPDNQLTIAGRTRQFPLPIHTVVQRKGMTAVLLHAWADRDLLEYDADADLDTDDHVFAFDSEGTVAWRKNTAYLGMSYQDEGTEAGLWLYPDRRMGSPQNVDIETGY